MVDAEIIKEWISKADEDFEFALSNLKERQNILLSGLFSFPASFREIFEVIYHCPGT